jgi:hypothetical protein
MLSWRNNFYIKIIELNEAYNIVIDNLCIWDNLIA